MERNYYEIISYASELQMLISQKQGSVIPVLPVKKITIVIGQFLF